MIWHKVGIVPRGKGERIEEEECKDDENASEDAPPQLLVHHGFDGLLARQQVILGSA